MLQELQVTPTLEAWRQMLEQHLGLRTDLHSLGDHDRAAFPTLGFFKEFYRWRYVASLRLR